MIVAYLYHWSLLYGWLMYYKRRPKLESVEVDSILSVKLEN